LTWRAFRGGQAVSPGWAAGDRVGLVVEGLVSAFISTRDGKRVCLALLSAGEMVGVERLLDALPSPGRRWGSGPEARALCDSRLAFVPADELLRAATAYPEFGMWMMGTIARGAQQRERRLVQAYTLAVEERILSALRELGCECGRAVGDAVRIEIDLTQDDIAELVGATRESVNRAVASLHRQGRLRRDDRRYEVLFRDTAPPLGGPAP
jgi:CRP/FNR family cyclic AMP-dependent transcriptional regulator